MKKADPNETRSAEELITARITELGDWRGDTLARMRGLIKAAVPTVVEEWKWANPVWSHDGIICTGESYKKAIKLTFAKGAFLKDPARLFNSSLDGNVRRAIDIHEGDEIDAAAFTRLIRDAATFNRTDSATKSTKATKATKATKSTKARKATKATKAK